MPKKLERCVKKVRAATIRRYGYLKYNPYAVCRASLDKKMKHMALKGY